jgi:hypothetical protein
LHVADLNAAGVLRQPSEHAAGQNQNQPNNRQSPWEAIWTLIPWRE